MLADPNIIDLEAPPAEPPENEEVNEEAIPTTPIFVERTPFQQATYNLVKSQIR
jgi:hypothetical protein